MINKKNLEIFQKKINYKFKDPSILKQSLTHPVILLIEKILKIILINLKDLNF